MFENSVKLPMVMPPCETYQGMAFIMGIILSYENIKNYFYNTYLNIRCVDSDRMWDLTLELNHILWDPLSEDGVFELDRYNSKVISKDHFIEFLKERIRQGNYILLFQIDEFGLKYSRNYQKKHFIHDIYIFGYDNSDFCVMAYKDDRLQMFNISQEEIRDSFYSCCDECDGEVEFCTCKPWKLADISVDYNGMKNSLKEYFVGCSKDGYSYGILIYRSIIKALKRMCGNDKRDRMDIRVFRMLWEHKYIMHKHLEKLGEKMNLNTELEKASEVEAVGKKLFRLSLKYCMSESDATLEKMIEMLKTMEKTEREYLSKLVVRLF